ncbi:MAG: hypothetical protein LAT63_14540 [Marinobacter sp.]|nr:hypothetical protein [Marinobacter sp.]
MLTEAQRQFYLGVAGIRLWYPRAALPGAAPSAALDFSEPASADDTAAQGLEDASLAPATQSAVRRPHEQASLARKSRLENVQALLGSEAAAAPAAPVEPEPAPVTATVAAPVVAEAPLPATAATPFALDWGLWMAERCVLISTWSGDVSDDIQDQLARNILRAWGHEAVLTSPVRWPVFDNPQVAGNSLADFSELLTDLFVRLESAEQLLVLGVPADQLAKLQLPERFVRCLQVDASLAAMTADPSLKRSLWRRMQADSP